MTATLKSTVPIKPPEKHFSPLEDIYSHTKLTDLLAYHPSLIVLSTDDTVSGALTSLAVENISSAPVVNPSTGKCAGFIDILDLLAYLVRLAGREIPKYGRPMKLYEDQIREILALDTQFKSTKIESILGLSGQDSFCVMDSNSTMEQAVQQYVKGFRRIAVVDNRGNLVGVVSQSAVVSHLARRLARMADPWLQSQIESFPYKSANIQLVDENTLVFDAFLQMHANKASAVGVADENGVLIGNLSASDLKPWHLLRKDMTYFLKPVPAFLKKIRELQGRTKEFVVAFTMHATIAQMMAEIHKQRVHRVYLLDSEGRPIGVITILDLIKGLYERRIHSASP